MSRRGELLTVGVVFILFPLGIALLDKTLPEVIIFAVTAAWVVGILGTMALLGHQWVHWWRMKHDGKYRDSIRAQYRERGG